MFVRICRTFSTIRMIRVPIHHKLSKARRKQEGFTLLELILVMVLLTGVMAVVAPSLSGFFRSAALDEEGRRMLSVIEMTRREAIANGFPTQLWLDAEKGLYGMRELQGVQADVLPGVDEKKQLGKRIYRMPPELLMELNDTSTIASIMYHPDGQLDVSSLLGFFIKSKRKEDQKIQITRSFNGLRFEIRKGNEMVPLQSEILQLPIN
ncbi:MAG: hypothetical protein CMI65_02815 [Pedosphaera sp.]|jgi:prepilin-type N-terminal cleavage/methylation domain-containing protein|nr:hypothetical protein [Pedosphaera sp.]HCQ84373.1 hypothetical protein [Verrucomicrobiales bacterium]